MYCGSFHCIDRDMGSGWLSTRARLCRVVGKKGVELVSFALYVYGVCHQVCVFSHQLRSSSSHGWQVWRTVEHPSDHMIPGQVTHQSTCLHGISQHQSHSMLWRRHMSTTPIVKVSLHHLVWPLLSEEVSHERQCWEVRWFHFCWKSCAPAFCSSYLWVHLFFAAFIYESLKCHTHTLLFCCHVRYCNQLYLALSPGPPFPSHVVCLNYHITYLDG